MNENSSPNTGPNNRGPRNENQRGGNRGGRRNNNGGPRRDQRDNNSRPPRERSNYGNRDNTNNGRAAKPLTFWQKIVAFFTGKPTTPAASSPASVHPTVRADRERTENRRSENTRSDSPRSSTGRPSDNYRRTETRPNRDSSESNEQESSATDRPEPRQDRAPREERSREPRTAEIVEVTSPKLYVGNLSFDAAESDLFDLFNGVGKVRNAEVVSNNYTQRSKGFAFVTMETIEEAKRAVLELHDKEFMGRKLLVSGAKTTERTAA